MFGFDSATHVLKIVRQIKEDDIWTLFGHTFMQDFRLIELCKKK